MLRNLRCTICNNNLIYNNDSEYVHLYCNNIKCPANKLAYGFYIQIIKKTNNINYYSIPLFIDNKYYIIHSFNANIFIYSVYTYLYGTYPHKILISLPKFFPINLDNDLKLRATEIYNKLKKLIPFQ